MGKLILNSIGGCEASCDYNFFIVRSAKSVPKGFHHIPELSPSSKLFFTVQKWKKELQWPDRWEDYRSAFVEEMSSGVLAEFLGYLEELLSDGNTVQLVCFCPNLYDCHRSIIGDYYQDLGYKVEYN